MTESPRFEDIKDVEEWPALVPSCLTRQLSWAEDALRDDVPLFQRMASKPLVDRALSTMRFCVAACADGYAVSAAQCCRIILEAGAAIALSACDPTKYQKFVQDIHNVDQKTRKKATDMMLDAARNYLEDLALLYDLVSQHFSHLSVWDLVGLVDSKRSENDQEIWLRARTIPLLLIFEAQELLCSALEKVIASSHATPKMRKLGAPQAQFESRRYIRYAEYASSEKHSRKNGIVIAMLFTNVKDINGEVGITDIYRGGMELFWYGDPSTPPDILNLKDFGRFALGNDGFGAGVVKIYEKDRGSKGIRYEMSWPKSLDVSQVAVALAAGNSRNDIPLFDFLRPVYDRLVSQLGI